MIISDKTYDRFKLVALLVAPVIVFLSAMCNIWNVPHTAEITATLAAIDTLFGTVVTLLKNAYDMEYEQHE